MKLTLCSVHDLDVPTRLWLADHLCRAGSEMQSEFRLGRADTPVVVVSTNRPIGWVCTHIWRDTQTIEGWIDESFRRRGLASAGVQLLLACGHLVASETVAVFSPDCVPLAKSLGFGRVMCYSRSGDDWSLTFS